MDEFLKIRKLNVILSLAASMIFLCAGGFLVLTDSFLAGGAFLCGMGFSLFVFLLDAWLNDRTRLKRGAVKRRRAVVLLALAVCAIAGGYFLSAAFPEQTYARCGNPPAVCSVRIGEPFILLKSEYSGRIAGGCFLTGIDYDKEYLEAAEPIIIQYPLDYLFDSGTVFHVFVPKKSGQTIVNTRGTCDYSRTYEIAIE